MKETPNKSNQHRKAEIPTSHKVPQHKNGQPDSNNQSQERAVTDIKQPDYVHQPKRKTDPSKYNEEE